jgi:hypothetical protein
VSFEPSTTPLLHNLAAFGASVFASARGELGDIDGGELQELMLQHGLLHEVRVYEACVLPDNEFSECRCCEYGDFPQDCMRPVDGLGELVVSLIKPSEPRAPLPPNVYPK